MSMENEGDRRGRQLGRRIRQIKVPGRSLTVGLLVISFVAGAYLFWRSPSMLPQPDIPVRFFQIATGSTAGTYYPVGELIATVISEPLGGEPCVEGGRCGVPGVLAVVKSSQGSIANVRAVNTGTYDAALAQADIARWAFRGEGIFESAGPMTKLRAIAALYPEAVHLVAAREAPIHSVGDLKSMRVSIDRAGSGTGVDARLILRAFGLSETDVDLVEAEPSAAVDMIAAGDLDALFLIAGTPAPAVRELVDRDVGRLVPISGPAIEKLRAENEFFVGHEIAAGTYADSGPVATLSVKSIFLTSADQPADLVHDITAALWRPGNRRVLDEGHAKGREILMEGALDGVPIPLHPGAERYYRAAGMRLRPAAAR